MNNKSTKQKFINLRLARITLKNISGTLGISMSTSIRWNKLYSEELNNLKNQNANSMSSVLVPKIDNYIGFFEKNFEIIQDELDKHNQIFLPYDKIIDNSIRIINTVQKLISLKKALSEPVPDSQLCESFLNSNDAEDIEHNNDESDENNFQ